MGASHRFVVDTHGHITTLSHPATGKAGRDWDGLSAEVKPEDNSALTLCEVERHSIDMLLLKPSIVGTTNEAQAKLVEEYPESFW